MIPRVFHQIWVNRQNPALPPAFQSYADKWRALNPQWQHRLWNLENLDFPLLRPELIPLCANYAQVADVLRLEVLYRYGGIYIDTDFEPLRPIDAVLHDVSHFFCSEDGVHISSGIIGAPAGSPLILRMLEGLPATLGVQPPNRETGPLYLTRNLLAEGFEGDVSFLPSRLFYPYGWQEPHRAHESFPEAVAVHRWAHSWAKPEPWSKRVRRRLGRVVLALRSG
jgi:mannosyltransferase OCH1-like enzyme